MPKSLYLTHLRGDNTIAPSTATDIQGGAAEAVEGDWNPKRIAILKFGSIEKVKEWYNSEEYQAILSLRTDASTGNVIFVDTP